VMQRPLTVGSAPGSPPLPGRSPSRCSSG
jgi:hypothetical protein